MRLGGRVAVITGAGQGIGKAYANRLAEEGAKVVIADINEANANSVANSLMNNGMEATAITVDVSNKESVHNMVNRVVEKYGKVDILVNNAAIFSNIQLKPFEELTIDEWDLTMAVNLRGPLLCCQAVIPHMKKQKSGRIINISSGTIFMGMPNYLHYVTSKAGVVGFTRALAREVGDYGVTVNTLCPGSTMTEISRDPEMIRRKKELVKDLCIKKIQEPEDLVGTLAYLASDDAGFVTGQMINVDGGWMMH